MLLVCGIAFCDICVADEGVKTAERCTAALYGGTAEQLAQLSQSELEDIFKNSSSKELFFDMGITLFDVVMKANCFRTESNDF